MIKAAGVSAISVSRSAVTYQFSKTFLESLDLFQDLRAKFDIDAADVGCQLRQGGRANQGAGDERAAVDVDQRQLGRVQPVLPGQAEHMGRLRQQFGRAAALVARIT